jgi:putative hemolysin
MGSSLLDYIMLVLCLVLSGFFSGTETALFSLRKADLHRFHLSKSRREQYIARVMREPQHILVTILIGNLFVNMGATAIATKLLLVAFSSYGHLLAIAIMTPVILLLCEIAPKLISINNNVTVSRRVVPVLKFFHLLFLPLRRVLVLLIDWFSGMFNIGLDSRASITKEELDMAVRLGEIEGVLNKDEGDFIKNVLRFSRKDASNVMVPRTRAVFVPLGSTVKDAMAVFRETGAVRLPVYDGDIDNVVGVLDSREILPFALGYRSVKNINRFLHTITHYPGSMKLDELLGDFLRKKIQLAVVMDEYGGTAGVVTLASIISEIIGRDYIGVESRKPEVRKTQDNTSMISGEMQIDDFNTSFGEKIESVESGSVGGYIIEKLERLPEKNDEIRTGSHVLKVRSVRKNRIATVEVIRVDRER